MESGKVKCHRYWPESPELPVKVSPRYEVISHVKLVSSCSNTGSIRDDPYWIFRKNSLELIELSSINIVSLVLV